MREREIDGKWGEKSGGESRDSGSKARDETREGGGGRRGEGRGLGGGIAGRALGRSVEKDKGGTEKKLGLPRVSREWQSWDRRSGTSPYPRDRGPG